MNKLSFLNLVFLVSAASIASAQNDFDIQTVVLEDDDIVNIGLVDLIDDVAINNNGDTLVEINTDNPMMTIDEALLFNGASFVQEGTVGQLTSPADAVVLNIASIDLNNMGTAGLHLFISSPDAPIGVYQDTQPIVLVNDVLSASSLPSGSTLLGLLNVKNNDVGAFLAVGDAAIDGVRERVIMTFDGNTQTVVVREGDILPGQTEMVEEVGLSANLSAINNSNDVLYNVELTGDSAADRAIYLNDTLIAQEGSPSPIAGRDYFFLQNRGMDLSNNGDIVFRTTLTGDASTAEALIRNGQIFRQEGDPAPDNSQFTSFGAAASSINISDNGDVLWFGQWSGGSGLFFNDTLLVQAGVTTIDGLLVDNIRSGTNSFSMSDNGEWIIFEALLEGGLEGAFVIQMDAVASIPGDVNCDGVVDLLDVAPFVDLILNGGFNSKADLNGDSVVDLLDVAPFVALLLG